MPIVGMEVEGVEVGIAFSLFAASLTAASSSSRLAYRIGREPAISLSAVESCRSDPFAESKELGIGSAGGAFFAGDTASPFGSWS